MTCSPVVLGADCSINHGESIFRILTFFADSGDPMDLASVELTIIKSLPASLKDDLQLRISNSLDGVVHLYLSAENAAKLGKGRVNWFILQTEYGPEDVDVTPKIWIQTT